MTEYVKWMPRNHGDYPPYWAKDMLASVDEDGEKVNADWAWLAWSTYYVPYEAVHGVRREVVEEGVEPVDLTEALQADNALKIPREPTQAMLKAGDLAWSEGTLILAIWQAMYDAALQETSDGQ